MAVNSLTLESYIQLHQALTKHGQVVQSVTPIEECYYKVADLRQFLQLHGFAAAGKFNRAELLAAIKGQKLINPFSGSSSSTASGSAASKPPEADRRQQQQVTHDPKLPFTAADVCSVLGMQGANPQELRFLPLGPAASSAAAAEPSMPATDHDTPPEDTPSPDPGNAAVGAAPAASAAADPAPAAAAPTASQQVHPSKAHSQQQQAGITWQPQQATATANAQPLQDPTSHNPQQHLAQQQVQMIQVHTEAAAGSSAAALQSSSLALGDPLLQQLLTRLLTQHAAGSNASQTLTQQQQQQQQQPAHNHQHHHTVQPGSSSASDLIAQLLTRGTGPAHSSRLPQPANPAASTATLPTAPPSVGTAAAPSYTPLAQQQQPQPEEVPATPAPAHTPWLRPQLQWLADNGLRVANPAAAAVRCRGDGLLQGCRVGFVLLEAMQVAGARNTLLTLPAGFYEVRAGDVCYYVSFLGVGMIEGMVLHNEAVDLHQLLRGYCVLVTRGRCFTGDWQAWYVTVEVTCTRAAFLHAQSLGCSTLNVHAG
jgi:hypothetical protein